VKSIFGEEAIEHNFNDKMNGIHGINGINDITNGWLLE
jgi:hypothetical protein